MYTVPSSWLHISENDQRVLSSLGPGSRTQGKEDWRGEEGSTWGPNAHSANKLPLTLSSRAAPTRPSFAGPIADYRLSFLTYFLR